MQSDKTKIAILIEKVTNLQHDVKELVTRVEFLGRVSPLEKVVYGMVAAVLLSVLGVVLSLVLKK